MPRTRSNPPAGPGTRAFWDLQTQRWEACEPQLLHSVAGVDPSLIRALAPAPGQRILDVGSGQGDPAIAFARLVAPHGRVLGVDISARMLAIARRRARLHGITNLRFRRADILRARLPARSFNGIYSRFGLMFAADIPAALTALRAALKPGGRAAFAVWGPPARNPWFRMNADLLRAFRDPPPPLPEAGPHPLRLGRTGLLARLLAQAGFRRVAVDGVRTSLVLGGEEEALRFTLGFPNPLRDLYLSLSGRDRARLRARLLRNIRKFRSGPILRIPEFAWVVSGRR